MRKPAGSRAVVQLGGGHGGRRSSATIVMCRGQGLNVTCGHANVATAARSRSTSSAGTVRQCRRTPDGHQR